MQVLEFDIDGYCAAESDLCDQHVVPEDDEHIEAELSEIQRSFAAAYPHLSKDEDYEFPPWHNHLLSWSCMTMPDR